jgi:hypothetical protein
MPSYCTRARLCSLLCSLMFRPLDLGSWRIWINPTLLRRLDDPDLSMSLGLGRFFVFSCILLVFLLFVTQSCVFTPSPCLKSFRKFYKNLWVFLIIFATFVWYFCTEKWIKNNVLCFVLFLEFYDKKLVKMCINFGSNLWCMLEICDVWIGDGFVTVWMSFLLSVNMCD